MQRLFSLQLGSKFLRDCSNTLSPHSLLHYKTLLLTPKTNPHHFQTHSSLSRPNQFFSRFTTSSHSEKIYGVFQNPEIIKPLVKYAISKATTASKSLSYRRVGFFRAQLPQRSFDFSSSFQGHRRGWQSWFQRQTPYSVTVGLILTNVAVFMLWRIADRQFMLKNFTISLENFRSGRVHTLITSAFSHIDVGHLISNMIGLYFFGMNIGRNFGPNFLLKLYFAGAVVGSVFYLVHHGFMALYSKNYGGWSKDYSRIPGLGASAAVSAIMLLDIFLFPKSILYLEFIIPVPAILLGIFLIGKDMLRILEGDSEVSGSAHLGGAVVAALAWARIRKGIF